MTDEAADARAFDEHRSLLLGLAYRMLGDVGRAEELVQDAWLRFRERTDEARDPRAYLVTIVTRLCLNELASARRRREEARGDRLPEPIATDDGPLAAIADLDRISMAFLVMLRRLTPSERAVLLLHDVFDFDHAEVAALVGKSAPACRKLLERARENVASERRLLVADRAEHGRLLEAFLRAARAGDVAGLIALLAPDAVLVADGGARGRVVAGVRNLREPIRGAERVAAFVSHITPRGAPLFTQEIRVVNGQPALVLRADGAHFGTLLLGVADGRVHRVYFHADETKRAGFPAVDPPRP